MIDKHVVIGSLLSTQRKSGWVNAYDIMGPDKSLLGALNRLVNQGSVQIRVCHSFLTTPSEFEYRLAPGSKYRNLVA